LIPPSRSQTAAVRQSYKQAGAGSLAGLSSPPVHNSGVPIRKNRKTGIAPKKGLVLCYQANQPENINASDARDAKDASREKNKTDQERKKNRKTGKKLFGVMTRRLSAFSCVPGFLIFLLILGSVAAFALKRLQSFPRCGNYVSTLWKNRVRKAKFFPHNGTTLRPLIHTMEQLWGYFSTLWKIRRQKFHGVEIYLSRTGGIFYAIENLSAIFPRNGK
jgi:hypothetical protein